MKKQQISTQFLIKKNPGALTPQSAKGSLSFPDEDIIRKVQKAMNGQAFKKPVESKHCSKADSSTNVTNLS